MTNESAAEVLGCPKGTVLSRLSWARERLRTRLMRRGLASAAALVGTEFSHGMLAASIIGIVFIPACFYLVENLSGGVARQHSALPPQESSPAPGD